MRAGTYVRMPADFVGRTQLRARHMEIGSPGRESQASGAPLREHAPPTLLIAADVGGTYARLGWAQMDAAGKPWIGGFRRYLCAEYSSLAAILKDFAATGDQASAAPAAVVAIAGVLEGDRLLNSNLAWPVSVATTLAESGLAELRLVNDFAAVGHAMRHVEAGALSSLVGAAEPVLRSPALILGPGTGLGAALLVEASRRLILPSEVGHAALAAGNELEVEVLRLLLRRHRHVDNERVLSGTGLMTLYDCLCELRGVAPQWQQAATLIEAARSGRDALARECVQVFCGWLGSLVGDLVVSFGARSVYLAGGVTAHLADFLHDGHFQQRYLDKGVLAESVSQVPVWRVEHGQLGVLGAAAWYAELQQRRD